MLENAWAHSASDRHAEISNNPEGKTLLSEGGLDQVYLRRLLILFLIPHEEPQGCDHQIACPIGRDRRTSTPSWKLLPERRTIDGDLEPRG
jgi:hypothetical protein